MKETVNMWVILFVFVRCILTGELIDPEWQDSLTADAPIVEVALNARAILSCNIVSKHLTNFHWVISGRVIENNKLWWNNETHGTMELHIKSVTRKDEGIYICEATSSNDTIQAKTSLHGFESDIIWSVEVLGAEYIGIEWDFNHVFEDTWKFLTIEYRENDTQQWLRRTMLSAAAENFRLGSLIIEALKPNTVYEVKGVIRDLFFPKVLRIAFLTWVTTSVPGKINERVSNVIAELNDRTALSRDVIGGATAGLTLRRIRDVHAKISTNVWSISETDVRMELEIANVRSSDDGFYKYQAEVSLKVKAISTDRIHINYNYTYSLSHQDDLYVTLEIAYTENGTGEWNRVAQTFDLYLTRATVSCVLSNLKNGTLYKIRYSVYIYNRRVDNLPQSFNFSKSATTFEKDVEYVPTVRIVDKTMGTVTIEWSQPPPELRENIDAYLILVMNGNVRDKHFRVQKYKSADGNKAVVHLKPMTSYFLEVRACFYGYCPDRHASVVMEGVMSNYTAGREDLRTRQELESDMESSVLTMNVTRDAEKITLGRNTSFTCSISVQGYEGWWTKEGGRITPLNNANGEINWTVIVGDAGKGNTHDYTCVAELTNDWHTGETLLVTVIPPTENINVEAEKVNAKPLESTALLCDVLGYRLSNFIWRKVSKGDISTMGGASSISSLNETHIRMMLYFANTLESDSGRYECQATNIRLEKIIGSVSLKVSDNSPLQLSIEVIVSDLIYLRWFDSDSEGDTYLLRSSENGSLEWRDMFSVPVVKGKQSYNGYVVRQLTSNTSHWFQLVLISAGKRLASTYSSWIIPTKTDPVYFPKITVMSKTTNSIIIEWLPPPSQLRPHITVYHISVSYTYNASEVVHWNDAVQPYRIVGELQPSTSYDLEVKACFRDISTDCYSSDVQRRIITESIIDKGKRSLDKESVTQVETWLLLSGIFFLLVGLGTWYFYKKVKKRRILRERLAYFYSENPIFFNPEIAISDQADLLPYEKEWEFPRKLLRLDDELGRGSFGIVWKARAKTIRRPEATSVVAVKTVRPTASLRCMKALLRELKILIYLGHHPNIVSLLGACTKDLDYGRLLVIVEFCRFGNLHDYLWRCRSKFVDELDADSEEIPDTNFDADLIDVESHSTSSALRQEHAISIVKDSCDTTVQRATSERAEDSTIGGSSQLPEIEMPSKYPGDFKNADLDPVRTRDLVSWAWQISRGMQYLADKKVLHADLAARNVLLCEDNIVKICDFGLSKSLQDDDDYKDEGNDPLPVKWMAIESIRDGIFSVKSDVWSFGVVLWELFSLAKTPYPEINPANMCETLVGGYRMERPKYAPKTIYWTMRQCWDANPSRRPTFVELERSIGNLLEENVKAHYVELYIRRERVYAEITDFRKTRIPENQELITLDPTEPTNGSQDEQTKKPSFRMRLTQCFRRG